MSNQEPRKNKTKEELEADIKTQQEVHKFRKFVKEEIYPFLLEHSTSVEDAKMMCQVLKMSIKQAVMNKEKLTPVATLEIPKVDEKYEKYNQFMKLFLDKTVFEVDQLLEGMSSVIDSFIREENTKRPLSELKAELLD